MTREPSAATAEIIAIGTELTSGAKLDTNSQWLSRELSDRGIAVRFHTTVADDYAANVLAVRQAIERAEVVLMTGGLGPTRDDITRPVFAEAIGVELVEDPAAVAHLQTFFEARGRVMPERNRLQALRPVGADLLPNPVGTAPGMIRWCDRTAGGTCLVAAMPGVPSEMKPMFLDHVVPQLPAAGVIARRIVNCYGIGESAAEELLGELTERGRDPEVGITASAATISLRILAAAATSGEADAKAATAEAEVVAKLAPYIFGRDTDDVEHAVVRLLADREATLGTIERGTAGEVAMRLARTAPPGQPNPADGLVRSVVGGAAGHITQDAAEHWAREAAASAEYGLAALVDDAIATAVPTPDGAAGYIAAACARTGEVRSERLTLLGNPAIHRARLAKSALMLLRSLILEAKLADPPAR